MTREEAIRILYSIDNADEMDEEYAEAYNMAIKALEREPCGDAISRLAAIVALDDRMSSLENVDMQIAMGFAKGIIHELPPVAPWPKMWHWIDEKDGYGTICSKCGKWYSHSIITKKEVLYCSSCGAKMQKGAKNERA